jgi:plastocyanin
MRSALTAAALLVGVVVTGAQAPTDGTIVGQVTLTTRVRGTALPSNVYQPRAVGNHASPAIPEIRNVVVSLKNVAFRGTLPITHREIRQEREEFTPRVLAVTKGSTVDFPNGDPVFHNVFSLSGAAAFDLGRYPMGRSKAATFTKPGLVKVYCHIHSQMSASIMVLDHPYFTIPELDGTFTIPHVPPGDYTIAGWHERVGERTVTVHVKAGQTVSVPIALPVEDVR